MIVLKIIGVIVGAIALGALMELIVKAITYGIGKMVGDE